MKINISTDRIFARKKKRKAQKIKCELTALATEARTGIDENNKLISSIDILKQLLTNYKETLNSLISRNKISKKEIEKKLLDEKEKLLLLNKNLKTERNMIKLKYTKTQNEINYTLSNLKTELDILVNRKFIFENALIEKENVISNLKFVIKIITFQTTYPIITDDRMEAFVNPTIVENDFSEILSMTQIELMLKCQHFNKYKNKIMISTEKKNNLLKDIKKMIDSTKNANRENNITKANDKDIINKYIDKLGEDSILNESTSSVYEDDFINIEFPDVITGNSSINKNNLEQKFHFPKFSLNQINYNKKRFKPEDAEKSLSRKILSQNSKDIKIKTMKDNIQKLKKKITSKEVKCKEFGEKIKDMRNFIANFCGLTEEDTRIKTEIKAK